jgi:hypothetical protein
MSRRLSVPDLDSTAQAAVETTFAPGWFIFLDVDGDPIRVTNVGVDVTFTSTGDADLDGFTFVSFGGQNLSVGDIDNAEGGSDTLQVALSGIVNLDTTLLNDIGDQAKWQGRTARIWMNAYDETGITPQGAVCPFYTGYMSSVGFVSSPGSDGQNGTQAIKLSVENWLAIFNAASNRSYLNQKDYDSADTSAAATIACSNGTMRNGGARGGIAGGSAGGIGTGDLPIGVGRLSGR